jgi:uncharacterized repeat protein (TIGR03803 family)
MTFGGGSSGTGTVFKVNTDSTGFQLLHSFSGGSGDGALPNGSLTLADSILYGMTTYDGSSNAGVIFKININGTGFQVLRSFTGAAGDGGSPYGSLILSGSTLYGMSAGGGNIGPGPSGWGTVFKISTNGTSFQLLHSFPIGGVPDGDSPNGSLALSGSTLYGMATYGGNASGSSGGGTIFKINTDGTGFQVLRMFDVSDGYWPRGSLTLSGSILYGMTWTGGPGTPCGSPGGDGTVFQINTNGTSFTILHAFDDSCSHTGGSPGGSLVLSNYTLYGMIPSGGIGYGLVFASGLPLSFQDWQTRYFGCTNCSQAATTADPDGDGQNNQAEFLSGTIPTNSASVLQIATITREGNNVRVNWTTGPGKTNALERTGGASGSYSTNFAAIFTVTNTTGTATNYLDVNAATIKPSLYYRVRLVP